MFLSEVQTQQDEDAVMRKLVFVSHANREDNESVSGS